MRLQVYVLGLVAHLAAFSASNEEVMGSRHHSGPIILLGLILEYFCGNLLHSADTKRDSYQLPMTECALSTG